MRLPIAGGGPAERADAARNRQKILRAAARLVAARGADALALDEVAAAAGVGVGTVYRRFADRGVLAQALLDERERRFQEAFISGPPPLGPGAPALERIRAFLHAFVDRLEEQGTLLMVAETATPKARFETGAYRLHHSHLAGLLAEARPGTDAHFLADALLAPLAAAQFVHQRENDLSVERIKAGLDQLLG
ncbi:TetR family transcriptional regulator [Actinophytocola xanthii]|uniref:TetR family transcriptional regulator n=1 Tax=Actinophytocola xanthii TaxID=1912961 RepID=A0A1Q8CR08_9PSEU|nr:TetR family transcriptional regulator [Actinophytocola xanthii]OLF16795.1 TetR family transcriptional regulator [Actinophytocola xanthii]